MEITNIRFAMMTGSKHVKAFVSFEIDGVLAVHDARVIDGRGGFFVAMPSKKITGPCPECGCKNHLRARYCNDCGTAIDLVSATRPTRFHQDIIHPINSVYRGLVDEEILRAYAAEVEGVDRVEHKPATLRDIVRAHVLAALERNGGRKDDAVRELGISLKTVYNKLHEYGVLEAA